MDKYPRTYHLSFSPEIHSDDKMCDMRDVERLIADGETFTITEKLDGGNCALTPKGVFARSHAQETSCPTFNYIKNVHYYPNLSAIVSSDLKVFGENLFAIHSIEYTNLKDYLYIFNILDQRKNRYISVDELTAWTITHDIPIVPVVFVGKIESVKWLEEFLADELKKPSALGGEREGFVVRVNSSFAADDFSKNVFKYVRRGHVQTDEHWSKNWVQAKLNKDGL